MNPDDLLEALRFFNVEFIEYAGWRINNHGPLDAHVLMIHDSVTGSMTDQRAAVFCRDGRSDLAGPLYEVLIGRDGKAHLVAFGITYNAGRGNQDRFMQAWRAGMPLDRELGRPGPDDYSDANAHCHGIAFITYGAGPYTPQQIEAGARICAAYIRAEDWGVHGPPSMIAHGEFSSRKIDPQLDMGHLRSLTHAFVTGKQEVWHIVVAGETLWGLARQYCVTVTQIKELNNLQGDVIGVGWRLRIK